MARARIARGFYPVVVPADSGGQPRFGRAGSKGKPKGKGQGKSKDHKPAAARRPRPKATSKGTGSRLHNGDDQNDQQHHPMEAQDDHLQFVFDAANEVT